MTTRFKDFGNAGQDPNAQPIKFKLHGEEFNAIPEIQGKVLLELIAESSEDGSNTGLIMTKFFSNVLLPESLTRFNALVESQDKIVSVDTLSEITSWLIEEYSNRPTTRSED
jgi:hypothetical protein